MELLIRPIKDFFPPPLPGQDKMRLYFHAHDGPGYQAHYEVMEKSRRLSEMGKGV